ncbi:unnamed protein product [Caenorhabditis sp. 36 PRJEB53466]|nr:unnamed protein product [Caenorhabditis sp. 36 PRJEB53466]
MGEPLVAEQPTTAQQSPLSTNSVAFQSSADPISQNYGLEDAYRALIYFCDRNSLDKKQVILGLFLSFLLVIFSVGTVIAWNRYSPIIQEFIIKENIEKARAKSSDKNKKEE